MPPGRSPAIGSGWGVGHVGLATHPAFEPGKHGIGARGAHWDWQRAPRFTLENMGLGYVGYMGYIVPNFGGQVKRGAGLVRGIVPRATVHPRPRPAGGGGQGRGQCASRVTLPLPQPQVGGRGGQRAALPRPGVHLMSGKGAAARGALQIALRRAEMPRIIGISYSISDATLSLGTRLSNGKTAGVEPAVFSFSILYVPSAPMPQVSLCPSVPKVPLCLKCSHAAVKGRGRHL